MEKKLFKWDKILRLIAKIYLKILVKLGKVNLYKLLIKYKHWQRLSLSIVLKTVKILKSGTQ